MDTEDRDVLAVCFTPAPARESPNIRVPTDSIAHWLYYRSMSVTFASARRLHPTLRMRLVTDVSPPAQISELLSALNVDIIHVPFSSKPPPGFAPTFGASLYTLDAIRMLAEEGLSALLVDPDVVVFRRLDDLLSIANSNRIGVYPTGFSPDEVSQGISARDASVIHQELNPSLVEVPTHFGGEIYCFGPDSDIIGVLSRCEEMLSHSISRWRSGQKALTTEEHILNYALRHSPVTLLDNHIRRIWTAPRHRNVRPDDVTLSMWHLPAEKHRGISKVFEAISDQRSWFWEMDDRDFGRRIGRIFGVPRRTSRRMAYDIGAAALRRFSQ